MNKKHTSTPWVITGKTGDGKYTIIDAPSPNDRAEPICTVEHDDVTEDSRNEAFANAAFIVKAVNLHDELVGVLEEIMGKNSTNFKLKAPDYLIDKCETILAKAKGAE